MNELQEKYKEQIEETVKICHKLAEDKYVTSHGGNISWAVDRTLLPETAESNILITPTQKFKGNIVFDDICIVDFKGNVLYAPENGKPTGELPFHILFYTERPDIVSVIHGHPIHATGLAMSEGPNYLEWPVLPEPTTEIGPVCKVPYAEPITDKLADNFRKHLDKYNAFLMESHGLVVMSNEPIERTCQLFDIVECTAASILEALKAGGLKKLSKQDVADLENTMKTRNIPLPGKPGVWKSLVECYGFD